MTTPYICASCRGRLSRQYRSLHKLPRDFRAGFISLSTPQQEQGEAAIAKRGDNFRNSQKSPGPDHYTKKSTLEQRRWPHARAARDEILESLFLSPQSQTSTERYKTPYSRWRVEDAAKPGHSNTSTTSSRKSPHDVSRTLAFRRVDIVGRPDITLKRSRPSHSESNDKSQ